MNLLVDDRRSPASMELNHENNAFKRPSGYRVYAWLVNMTKQEFRVTEDVQKPRAQSSWELFSPNSVSST